MAEPGQPVPRGPVRDRDVVLSAVMVVAFVLAVAWISGVIEPLNETILFAPLIIVALILVTAVVLFRAVRPR